MSTKTEILLDASTDTTPGPIVELDEGFRRLHVIRQTSSDYVSGGNSGVTVEWSDQEGGPWESLGTLGSSSASSQASFQVNGFYRFVRAKQNQSPSAGNVSVLVHFD